MKKSLSLLLCLGLCGCATLNSSPANLGWDVAFQFQKFVLNGVFQNNNELFIGQILSSNNGNIFIEIKGGSFGVTCKGTASIVSSNDIAVRRKGEATLNCTDGRIINAEFITTSDSSGYGSGTDHKAKGADINATDLTFTYGMGEDETIQYLAKEQTNGKDNNIDVYRKHYKELMEQIKEDEVSILNSNQANNTVPAVLSVPQQPEQQQPQQNQPTEQDNGAARYAKILQSWVGGNIVDLINSFGAPDSSVKLPNGDTLYTWVRSNGAIAMPVGNMAFSVDTVCKTTFTVDQNGTIINWQTYGNICRE